MFTGIIEELGEIKSIDPKGKESRLTIKAKKVLEDAGPGDSISANGVCLTVVNISKGAFSADISLETLKVTNLGNLKIGDKINLERSLKITDRLSGHIVSGHVDGTGVIKEKKIEESTIYPWIEVPDDFCKYMVLRGSIAVDGVSLTIAGIRGNRFKVAIIPHTASLTTLGVKGVGDSVNIEVDMVAKYIEKILSGEGIKKGEISKEYLEKYGFS